MSVAVGTFSTTTGTSNVVVSGLGFQPQVVLFWWSRARSGDSQATNMGWGFGAATSSTVRWAMDIHQVEGGTQFMYNESVDSTVCVVMGDGGSGSRMGSLDFSTMDTGGFTLVVDDAFDDTYVINYMAINGLDSVAVGTQSIDLLASSVSVSGLGFQPDAYLVGAVGQGGNAGPSIGWSDGTNHGSLSIGAEAGTSTSNVDSMLSTDHVITSLNPAGTNPNDELTHTSMDSGGFTLAVTTGSGFFTFGYVAFESANGIAVGTKAIPVTTGSTTITGMGFQPEGIMMMVSAAATANETSPSTGISVALGAASGASAMQSQGCWSENAASGGDVQVRQGADLLDYFEDRATHVAGNRAEVALTSFDASGVTLNVTNAGDTADLALWIAFGSAGGGGGLSIPVAMNHYINQGQA